MKTTRILLFLAMSLLTLNLEAQVIRVDVKITDNDGKVAMITAATTSAATGCASPDFPVIRNGEKEQALLEDYKYISVMPYETSSNETLYIVAELEKTDGSTEKVEMSKHLRFNGHAIEGEASLTLKDISMIEVFVDEE
jgi:hypothetical protein